VRVCECVNIYVRVRVFMRVYISVLEYVIEQSEIVRTSTIFGLCVDFWSS